MWTQHFWRDALERAAKTVAQVVIVALVGDLTPVADKTFNVLTADWTNVGAVAAGAFILSILFSVASGLRGSPDSASALRGH